MKGKNCLYDHSSTELIEIPKEIKLQPPCSPHIAGEYCAVCGKWLRWIGKKEYARLIGDN